jgi:hypothetical protein
MVSSRVGQRGVNLIDTSLIPLVQWEIAYREVGAVIHTERLWSNLLTSQALVFNLFGPFKQNLALATTVMRRNLGAIIRENRIPSRAAMVQTATCGLRCKTVRRRH